MTDGLVTALEKDGYPSREACLADSELERVAADCDLLFTTMARFASPEVKREVLRQLLVERLASPELFTVRWSRIIEIEADVDPTINEEALVNLLTPEVGK